jgi:hypothetical protein
MTTNELVQPKLIVECDKCDKEVVYNTVTEVDDGSKLCLSCMDTYVQCVSCEDWTEDYSYVRSNDEHYCESCAGDYLSYCETCEEMVYNPEMNHLSNLNLWVCDGCIEQYTKCEHCDEWLENDYAYIRNETTCCSDCADRYYSYCDECDEYYDADDTCCDDRYIHNYSYKPDPIFHGGRQPDKLFVGMELEVQFAGASSSELQDYAMRNISLSNGILYNKWDGSIDSGFEVVSHPINIDEFNNLYPFNAIENMRNNYGRSWDASCSCGIHIHMSRKAFTWQHEYKFAKFFATNVPQIKRIAGRDSDYARFEFDTKEFLYLLNKDKYRKQNLTQTRNRALNLSGDSTIEVRIFKGTLNEATIKAYVEFVHSVFYYTKGLSSNDILKGKLEWSHYLSYVMSNKDRYENLIGHTKFNKGEK